MAASTWLYRIAVNPCADRNRRTTFRRFVGLEDVTETLPDDTPDAARTRDARRTLSTLRQVLQTLPTRQRQARLLRVIAAMGTANIAAALNTSTGATEQLLVRARATLRRADLGEGE